MKFAIELFIYTIIIWIIGVAFDRKSNWKLDWKRYILQLVTDIFLFVIFILCFGNGMVI